MAVMQTPHGRVIGLIFREEDQPAPKAIEKKPEPAEKPAPAPAKRAGRPAKK